MRIKFLSVIVSFLVISMAVSSCLDSDETYEYSSDATIHAFGIDSIHGKYYKFTIDQLNRLIYNRDSLPVDADTIIDRILIDTMTVQGWVTTGAPADTLFSTADSVDLRPAMNNDAGMKFIVHAPDGVTIREYTLKVNVHLQDPDSLVWREMTQFPMARAEETPKAVYIKGNLWVYTSATSAYKISTDPAANDYEAVPVRNLPSDTDLSAIVSCRFANEGVAAGDDARLYVANGGKVYSSEDGATWNEVTTLGSQVKALIGSFRNTLTGIIELDGKYYFNVSKDGETWQKEAQGADGEILLNEVPEDFPLNHIYTDNFFTANGIEQAIAVGTPRTSTKQTLIWLSTDGCEWVEMSSTLYDAYCPQMTNPFVMCYGELFYCFGDGMDAIYSSITGISWHKVERKFLLPEAFAGNTTPYSITIDDDNFIWIVFGGGNEDTTLWRGRLNRLGFKEQ